MLRRSAICGIRQLKFSMAPIWRPAQRLLTIPLRSSRMSLARPPIRCLARSTSATIRRVFSPIGPTSVARSNRQGESTGWDISRSPPGSNCWREYRHRVPLRERRAGTVARACCGSGPARRGHCRHQVQSGHGCGHENDHDHPHRHDQQCRSGWAGFVASTWPWIRMRPFTAFLISYRRNRVT